MPVPVPMPPARTLLCAGPGSGEVQRRSRAPPARSLRRRRAHACAVRASFSEQNPPRRSSVRPAGTTPTTSTRRGGGPSERACAATPPPSQTPSYCDAPERQRRERGGGDGGGEPSGLLAGATLGAPGRSRRKLSLQPGSARRSGANQRGQRREAGGGPAAAAGAPPPRSPAARHFRGLVRRGELQAAAGVGPSLTREEAVALEPGFIRRCCATGGGSEGLAAALEYARVVRPSRPYFCILIKELGRQRNLRGARLVYKYLQEEGIALNSYLISAMVSVCGKCGQPVLARAYFDAAARGFPSQVDITCYNALMDAFGRSGDVDSVFALLRTITSSSGAPSNSKHATSLQQSGGAQKQQNVPAKTRAAGGMPSFRVHLDLHPNTRSFNIAICAAARAQDVSKARAAWERMLRTPGAEPSHHTFSTLIRLAGESGDLVWATDLYTRMREIGLRPNNHVASAFLSVCARALRTAMADSQRELGSRVWSLQRASLLAQADTVLREVRRAEEPNEAVYNAFITCCERAHEPERAWAALRAMEESGLHPNLFLLSSMLKVCKIGNDVDGVRRLVHMYIPELGPLPSPEELEESRLYHNAALGWRSRRGHHSTSFSSTPGGQLLRSSVNGEDAAGGAAPGRARQQHERTRRPAKWVTAADAREEMLSEGSLTHVYNSFIDFCASAGLIDVALRTYARMCEAGPAPDLITYNTLIKGCSSSLQTDRVQQLYCDLLKRHLKPNQITFGAIIDGFGLRGESARAWQWVTMMEEHGFEPNVQVYTSLINSAVKRRDGHEVKHALVAFERMCARGVQPNVQTYGALLKACRRSSSAAHARDVYEHMLRSGVPPNDACHTHLLAVFKNDGRLSQAISLVQTLGMEFKHVASKDFTPSVVRALCSKDIGETALARDLMQNLRSSRKQPDRRTYSAMVEALAREGELTLATEMHEAMKQQHYQLDIGGRSELVVALSHAGLVARAISLLVRDSKDTHLTPWAVCSLICACGRGSGRLSVALQLYDKLVLHTATVLQPDPRRQAQHQQHRPGTEAATMGTASSLIKVTATDISSILAPGSSGQQQRTSDGGTSSSSAFDLATLRAFQPAAGDQRAHGLEAIRSLSNKGGMMFEVLVEGLCRANYVEEALIVFDDMVAVGGSMSTATLAFLYACCMRSCYGDHVHMDQYAERIRQQMRERQQQPSPAEQQAAGDAQGSASASAPM